jgi:hypothetical protein
MTARSITGMFVAAALAVAVPCTYAQEKPAEKPAKPAASAPAAPPAAPKPPAEMSQLKFFEGNWTCKGEMSPGPGAPMVKSTSSVKSATALGGFWQAGTVRGTMPGMPAFEGKFHMTYDPGAKQYVMVWVDNMGSRATSMAPGWEGDAIAFTGEGVMGGQKIMGRDTFTKKEGALVHKTEMELEGKWTNMGEETCKKAAAAPAAKKE